MGDKDTGEKAAFSTIILAAGKGTRMKSELAKVLHPIGGTPMLSYTVAAARAAGSSKIAVVIGHQSERIREIFQDRDLIFVEQKELLGTGHAVLQAKGAFGGEREDIVILCGDVPLVRPETLKALHEKKRQDRAAVVVLTMIVDNPDGYGRVLKTEDGQVIRIVEEKDATAEEKRVREINTGIYCAESRFLFAAVGRLENNNAQREYYLTDIIEIASQDGLRVTSLTVSNPREVMGINTLEELRQAETILKNRTNG
jgi:UDP-N-acetylglucosamine diphosphorylase/glucosamine-1-phosphate N-acetyltransferase